MTLRPWILALTAAGLLASSPVHAGVLKMDGATQHRLGIVAQPLALVRRAPQARAFARVVDAGPLAALDADIAAAAAAARASRAEADRAQRLSREDQAVSRRAAEAAQAQAEADAARLALLRRRLGLEWGSGLTGLSDGDRGRLLDDLAAGRAALVRLDAATGLSTARGGVTLDLGPQGQVAASILGPARTAEPRLQSTGLLALARGAGAQGLGAGAVVPALITPGGARDGVLIPRAALLRSEGETFVYLQRPGGFERRKVEGTVSEAGGLFAPGADWAGQKVVTTGAAKLLAAASSRAGAE